MFTISGTGIYAIELRYGPEAEIPDMAAELEALGYTALWIPDVGGPVLESLDTLLAATSTITVGTSVLNIWQHEPARIAAWWHALAERDRARVTLGLGVSHAMFIEQYATPLASMRAFLDELDADGFPADARLIGALGPKMVELARTRAAGAFPYLTTPEHTASTRAAIGDGCLCVEQGAILARDPGVARAAARAALEIYFELPNYANNWRRLGFTDDDITSRSDRLVDALVVWGDADAIAERVDAHRRAGADHVAIQLIAAPDLPSIRHGWRALAPT